MSFFVYILYSENFDKFYVGQTNDVSQGLNRHNCGYEKATAPWIMAWVTHKDTRTDAMILEKKLKNLSKDRIRQFIHKYS